MKAFFKVFLLLSLDVGATAADPLSEFCNDVETAPDEVFIIIVIEHNC